MTTFEEHVRRVAQNGGKVDTNGLAHQVKNTVDAIINSGGKK
jgi:hypothetical protein